MLMHHLGKEIEIDENQAALELRIIRQLKKLGKIRQARIYLRTRGPRFGVQFFQRAIDRLVTEGVVRRDPTNHSRGFWLSLAEAAECHQEKASR